MLHIQKQIQGPRTVKLKSTFFTDIPRGPRSMYLLIHSDGEKYTLTVRYDFISIKKSDETFVPYERGQAGKKD